MTQHNGPAAHDPVAPRDAKADAGATAASQGPRDERPEGDAALETWWAGLGPEEKVLVEDAVRLDQGEGLEVLQEAAPAGVQLLKGKKLTPGVVEFVRRQPDYEARFAITDNTARIDSDVMGRDIVPDSHAQNRPLTGER
ncbi:hypothetical protein [Nigerium massiliense]|uniref:hypothetical protein n=1 Tax=Nigerium massiliense TaxID=1522317 RepID=UPI00058F0011|nr:hypothetical protein [Nigerium massiliense]